MSTIDFHPSNVGWLAQRLEEDVRARRLRAGEPYLTSAQVGRQLGISKSMAYRAMKILVARRVLVSHPGRGTFVGPQVREAAVEPYRTIHVLLTQDYFQSVDRMSFGCLAGLTAVLPGYGIQFNFLQLRSAETQVGRLLEQAAEAGTISAAVLLGCPRLVQEQVLRHSVPALVLGTDYSSTRQLPSVDADQYEIGRLAAEYLLGQGCRRIALLMRETWFPGDQRMYEGVGHTLDEAGLGHMALVLCNFSIDAAALSADLRRLLTAENRPSGCICRMPLFAQAVVKAATAAGLEVPKDLEVISDGLDRQTAAQLGLPSICREMNVEEQVAVGGRMLKLLLEGKQPDPLHAVLSVALIEPERRKVVRPRSGVRKRGAPPRKRK